MTSALIYHFVAVPWACTIEIIQFGRNFAWLTTTRYFLGSDLPTSKVRDLDPGIGRGASQQTFCRIDRAVLIWGAVISKAKRAAGARSLAACGSVSAKRSTARRVTRSNLCATCSARTLSILTSVNVRERATSRRNVAFLWFDSISVRAMSGAQSFMGTPGKPAPEPMSATRGVGICSAERPRTSVRA